ncbi:MAG: hypothetical protein MUP03_10110 [Anaerolineales bacterium]|nr:hypothetical protein [Anaerolineales bacterium]
MHSLECDRNVHLRVVLARRLPPRQRVDVLVAFAPQANVSLFDMVHMQDELKAIFGHEVNLVSKRGVEASRNYLRRKAILESAEVIHVAR